MNLYELGLFVLATLLLAAYLYWKFKSPKIALLLVGISLLPLYLSIEQATQFLTIDEPYFLEEVIYVPYDDLSLWFIASSGRTTQMLTVLPVMIHHKFFPALTDVQVKILLKDLHWLLSFLVILAIHHVLSEHFVPPKNKKVFFVGFIYTALLLPTNALALKVFNYDALSMLPGVLALLCAWAALKTQRPGYAWASIISAFLAAQEKMVTSPILLISLAVFGCVQTASDKSRRRYTRMAGYLLLGIAAVVVIGLGEALMIARARHWDSWQELLLSVPDPLVTWILPFLKFTFGSEMPWQIQTAQRLYLLPISLMLIYLLALGLLFASRLLRDRTASLTRAIACVNMVLLPVILVAGIIGFYWVHPYLAPYTPVAPGDYQPGSGFGFADPHFGAHSLAQHLALSVAYAYAHFVSAIPSIFWLVYIAIVVAQILRQPGDTELGIEVLLTVGLLIPLGFGLFQIPSSRRYLDIGLFLATLMLVLKIVRLPECSAPVVKPAAAASFVALLVLEILPFAPLYGPFRPIWLNHDRESATTVTLGQPLIPWHGWGEETMQVGHWLEGQCVPSERSQAGSGNPSAQPCGAITLYSVYSGEWLDEETEIRWLPLWRTSPGDLGYTEFDYYIINRNSVIQGREGVESLPDTEPVFVIAYRGEITAWVYRGDRLREIGFAFR
jgi:hypothetical protein